MGFIAPLKIRLSTKVTKEHEEKPSSIFVSFVDIFIRTLMNAARSWDIPLNSLGMECLHKFGLVCRLFCKYLAHQITNLHNLGIGNSIDRFAFLSLRGHDAV